MTTHPNPEEHPVTDPVPESVLADVRRVSEENRLREQAAEQRSLVEAWGVRDGQALAHSYEDRAHAERAGRNNVGDTVVPLIAADRLTDEALHDSILARLRGDFWTLREDWTVGDVLAALRAHLEGL